MKLLPPNASARQMQSEMGVTGEYSPNLEVTTEAMKILCDNFRKPTGSKAERDCFILITDCHLGARIDTGEDHRSTLISAAGYQHDQIAMITKAMVRCPDLIATMSCAIANAIMALKPGQQQPVQDPGE